MAARDAAAQRSADDDDYTRRASPACRSPVTASMQQSCIISRPLYIITRGFEGKLRARRRRKRDDA